MRLQASKTNGGLRTSSLTRDFKETVRTQRERVPAIREIRLEEGAECLLAGDVEAGKAILRDHVDAAVGFQEVAGQTNKSSKSLMRMPGPHANPQVRNLLQIIGSLQKRESVQLKVQTVR